MQETVKIKSISGFPEWLPDKRILEQKLIDIIRKQYELYGFAPIETPAVERWEVLHAKGGEVEKQVFPVGKGNRDRKTGITTPELGLHFDLTVPLARYVAQYSNDLVFPFRRYQIQKVWRGEKAQKGRFREFMQCDIDIIGRTQLSLLNDAEIPCVINSVFENLDVPDFHIRINNRKIVDGLCKDYDCFQKADEILSVMDSCNYDVNKMTEDLRTINVPEGLVDILDRYVRAETYQTSSGAEILENTSAWEGIQEVSKVIRWAVRLGTPVNRLRYDPLTARGLDYYTGTVYETFINGKEEWGSVCSGGRYDNLASYFSKETFPGVGISIGLSRLLDLLLDSDFIKVGPSTISKVLVTKMDDKYLQDYLALAKHIRENQIPTEVYLDESDLRGQLAYASKKGIRFVIIAGSDELNEDLVKIKDMDHRTEELITCDSIVDYVKKRL